MLNENYCREVLSFAMEGAICEKSSLGIQRISWGLSPQRVGDWIGVDWFIENYGRGGDKLNLGKTEGDSFFFLHFARD